MSGEISFPYEIEENAAGLTVKFKEIYNKTLNLKIFKSFFHKATAWGINFNKSYLQYYLTAKIKFRSFWKFDGGVEKKRL